MEKPSLKRSNASASSSEHRLSAGFPKRLIAAIKNMPLAAVQQHPPEELKRICKKLINSVGEDAVDDHLKIFAPLWKHFPNKMDGGSAEEALDQTSERLNAVMCNNQTFSATVPVILERAETRKMEVIGSGVLLQIMNSTFLLTAAHVNDLRSIGLLLIPGERDFQSVRGKSFSMRLPESGRRSEDLLDVAFCNLEEDCVAELHSSCRILERADVFLEAMPVTRNTYTFAGYPWRKTNATAERIETQFETNTGMEAKASEYEALGLNRSEHIAIRFHRRKTFLFRTRRVGTATLPHGMSGGGIYAWTEAALEKWPVQLPLAGIGHTYLPEKSLLIGTRLHVYVAGIFKCLPDLAANAAR